MRHAFQFNIVGRSSSTSVCLGTWFCMNQAVNADMWHCIWYGEPSCFDCKHVHFSVQSSLPCGEATPLAICALRGENHFFCILYISHPWRYSSLVYAELMWGMARSYIMVVWTHRIPQTSLANQELKNVKNKCHKKQPKPLHIFRTLGRDLFNFAVD